MNDDGRRARRVGPGRTRRELLCGLGALGFAAGIAPGLVPGIAPRRAAAATGPIRTRAVPASGEPIPVIGMGSWITFDVGHNPAEKVARIAVLQRFFDAGGGLIDSSPMYGSSEEVIGYCLGKIADTRGLFAATKVWTLSEAIGIHQMESSRSLWGVPRFDLMQIHNLLDWQTHIETLVAWKAAGRIRYIGITTSHGRRHAAFARLMTELPLDFVQFTYNILDREAERRLLPLAAERGLAVIVNRPFRRGALFDGFEDKPLPDWAAEFDCRNWAQFFLKFIVSHPAVTCAIPATSRVDHMAENMGAAYGRLPDPDLRARMVRYVEDL